MEIIPDEIFLIILSNLDNYSLFQTTKICKNWTNFIDTYIKSRSNPLIPDILIDHQYIYYNRITKELESNEEDRNGITSLTMILDKYPYWIKYTFNKWKYIGEISI